MFSFAIFISESFKKTKNDIWNNYQDLHKLGSLGSWIAWVTHKTHNFYKKLKAGIDSHRMKIKIRINFYSKI